MALRVKGKIWKTGNGYVLTIPKTLVESGNFELGQEIQAELEALQVESGRSRIWTSDQRSFAFIGQLSRFTDHLRLEA